MPRLLCITAHPDDEAGNFGGTLAALTDHGVQVRLVCLTGGEAARNRGTAKSMEELKALRAGELEASCRLLGIGQHEIWDLPDSGLPRTDFSTTAGRLADIIRDWRPDLVLTMGPEGSLTGHPDHGMAGMLATAAFHWAANERAWPLAGAPAFQVQRLWYGSGRASLPNYPDVQLSPPHLVCDIQPWLERKQAAFHCHQTQAPLFPRFDAYLALGGGLEYFHLAASPPDAGRITRLKPEPPDALISGSGLQL